MSEPLAGTPAADGYRMPGEFEPHSGCWMLWPERPDNWRQGGAPAQEAFAAVALAIAASEPVTIGASAGQLERCRSLVGDAVRIVELESDDSWMRDVGPSFLVGVDGRDGGDGEPRGVDWRFNAWGGAEGGLYASWERDDAVAERVLEVEGAARYRAPIVLEGGSIHVDGRGTVLTTEECLLNHNRNPSLSREQIEQALHEYLGAERVVWLGRGLPDDETDGHIDNLACFAEPGVVLLSHVEDRDDPRFEVCDDALTRLLTAGMEVVLLPSPGLLSISAEEAAGVEVVPGTQPRRAGDPMAASYANFFIANERVVYPLLDERTDERAASVLSGCFPGRVIVGVPAREILLGGGNIHCITQQVPRYRGENG
ncbi:MAG TPA: agmatine deiminase [Solirubrobacteraceae bacterium]